MDILRRSIFDDLFNHLQKDEVTLLTGSRQVGKTTLLKDLEKELSDKGNKTYFLTLERAEIRRLLDEKPENLFSIIPYSAKEKQYVIIDEIQYLSDPTNFLKLIYDEYKEKVKLIVTGSSAFYIDRKFKDSLAGRKRIFHLKPFSFKEMLLFHKEDELAGYTEMGMSGSTGLPLMVQDKMKHLAEEYMLFGGYPKVVTCNDYQEKQQILADLIESFLKKDALEANIRKETEFMHFVEVLADRIGNKINRQELSNICNITDETVQNFLYVLQKSFHISYVRPFWKSKTSELRKMPKTYFQDTGLRNAVLNNFAPVALRNDKGELAENMTYILLKKHFAKDQIQYWITREQNEVDFILNKKKAIEVKYNGKNIRSSKYKLFQQTYPEIPLQFVCMDNIGNNTALWCL